MNPHASLGFAGHFTMTVSGGKRGTKVLAEFDNMILDSGLNYLAGGNRNAVSYCFVGTGTTAVAASQTTLVNAIANSSTWQRPFTGGTYVAGPPAYKTDYITFRFAAGIAAGNLTEVGVGWNSSGSLFSRALILDGGGSPTSITVLSDETLDVTYTLRCYAPDDVTGIVSLGGVNYNYTIRAAQMALGGTGSWNPGDVQSFGFCNAGDAYVNTYTGSISATPGDTPSGASWGGAVAATPSAYVNNSLRRTVQYRLDLNDGNLGGGIKSMNLRCQGDAGYPTHAFQVEFSPNVPKDNTKVLKLNFTFSVARAP